MALSGTGLLDHTDVGTRRAGHELCHVRGVGVNDEDLGHHVREMLENVRHVARFVPGWDNQADGGEGFGVLRQGFDESSGAAASVAPTTLNESNHGSRGRVALLKPVLGALTLFVLAHVHAPKRHFVGSPIADPA